jgi:hypothetical protein
VTGSAADPADRTRRFLRKLSIDEAVVASRAREITVELVAARLDPATEIALAMTAILLLRLADFAPTVHLVVPRDRTIPLPRLPDTALPGALVTAHEGIVSADRVMTGPARDCDVRLVFSGPAEGIAVTTAGWAVSIGHRLDGTGNGLAAAYAGVLAAAEAFKAVLAGLGVLPARTRPWRGATSLWDYTMSADPGPLLPGVHLAEHAWVGAGGVASATAWALAALHHSGTMLTGHGQVVDDDAIDEDGTNLNRHLIALMTDLNTGKAELLAEFLRPCGLALTPQPRLWGSLSHGQRHPPLAVVSVDSDKIRRDVQYDMPATVLNAGTGDQGTYQATAHNFLDGACLACISRADMAVSGPEYSLATRLRIPQETLRPLLLRPDPLPAGILARARLTDQDRSEISLIPGRDLLRRFCDELSLQDDGPAVSAPMLSAAAGVLLAVDMAKQGQPRPPAVQGRVIRTNILAGPHSHWHTERGKTPGCHCADPLYRQHYHTRWPA